MSIHKSKGLEFPIVFLSGAGKQFNMQDLNEQILLDQDMGFGPKYINFERKIEYNTIAKEAIKIKSKTELLSEEMRLLYVALTRAKEKIIITGVEKDLQKALENKQKELDMYDDTQKIPLNLVKKSKTYLDWLELIYEKEGVAKTEKIFRVNVHNKKELLENLKKEEKIEEDIYQKIIENAKKANKEEKQKIFTSFMDEFVKLNINQKNNEINIFIVFIYNLFYSSFTFVFSFFIVKGIATLLQYVFKIKSFCIAILTFNKK